MVASTVAGATVAGAGWSGPVCSAILWSSRRLWLLGPPRALGWTVESAVTEGSLPPQPCGLHNQEHLPPQCSLCGEGTGGSFQRIPPEQYGSV